MKNDHSIIPIFLVVFIDLIGVGIALPILAPMFLDIHSTLFAATASIGQRTIMLGILLALYPAAQFFGAPILGSLSDFYGRKRLLLVSLFGTFSGYVLFAIGITLGNIWLLIIGRIIDGFTGGNISIAQSAIADMSDPQSKAKNFGLIGMAFGLGFILGPFIGGKLGDSSVMGWFNYSTPFWFAAILCACNIVLMLLLFHESLKEKVKKHVDLFVGLRNLKTAFSVPNLRVAFIVVFLISFGFTFFTQFFQVYLIELFGFMPSQIGDFFAFMGICIALTQGIVLRYVSRFWNPQKSLKYAIILLASSISLYLFISQKNEVYLILPLVALFNGIVLPNTTALISNLGDGRSQGELLGINQSVISVSWALPALISGFLSAIDARLPILISCVVLAVSWLVFILFYHEKDKTVFHEKLTSH